VEKPITLTTNGTRQSPYAFLQHTAPGTPAGALLREYWQPVGLSTDVTAGGAPHPVRVMGEDLVLFRDDAGRPGLVGRKCAHRCADLSYGRVEDGGLRCLYHGWLFAVDGRCIEQPAEGANSTFKDKVRQKAYPAHEAGGAIWAYMGAGEPPLFPNYPAIVAPEPYRMITRWYSNCNWMQGSEGNIDPVHTSYLHRFGLDVPPDKTRLGVFASDGAPDLDVEETRFGLRIYADRKIADSTDHYLRITNFVMPNTCAINGAEADLGPGGCGMSWNVPIDDEHHWRYSFTFHAKAPMAKDRMSKFQDAEKIEGTDVMRRNAGNRYLQDRESMSSNFIGLGKVFPVHDIFITESQGPILPHDEEHLASSDVAILRARKMLAEAAKAVAAGKSPPGVVRDPVANNFNDIVVITKRLAEGVDSRAYCEELAGSDLYTLEPFTAAASRS
jgi:phthalate 4,5-dioxygenase oxygenase subunit